MSLDRPVGQQELSCACGQVQLAVVGEPIVTAACYCDDCQAGAALVEALPGARAIKDADGGTWMALYRNDRYRVLSGGELLERVSATIAIQGNTPNRRREFRYDADMVALARAAHSAIPEIPLKGIDILKDHKTGRLYVIEVNPNSNTWHFSSGFLAEQRRASPEAFNRQRLEMLDAFGTAAHVLAEVTAREAE